MKNDMILEIRINLETIMSETQKIIETDFSNISDYINMLELHLSELKRFTEPYDPEDEVEDINLE